VRFARLIHRRVRVLGVPSARAACGGNLSLPWWPRRVVAHERRRTAGRSDPRGVVVAFKLLEAAQDRWRAARETH
jgi:hypothetical protein